jgi:phage terminase large subunit GpA-like protein
MESWSDICARGEAAPADPAMLKVWTQQDLGEPYEPKNDTPDWEKLLGARKPWPRGVVPWPASVLTGFIDVQGNRCEWGLWAWGEGFCGWLVDRGVIAHSYTEDEAWVAIDALTSRRWPTAGAGELTPGHSPKPSMTASAVAIRCSRRKAITDRARPRSKRVGLICAAIAANRSLASA